jgi:probable rRNA maturation factor
MILLDPDLDPDPTLTSTSVKQLAASGPSTPNKDLRLPSARALARFLAGAQAAIRLKGEVTVLLTTDATIRKLNRQFRGKNQATDVLSFPAEGIGVEKIAGDLAISVPAALKQAVDQGHSLATEIKVLILHGLLHLAGYDHETDEGKMARRERLLRARLNLPQGLIERTANAPKAPVLKGHDFSRAAKADQVKLLKGHAFSRAAKADQVKLLKGHDFSRAAKADQVKALKGHGFSRAAKTPKKAPALAAEGSSFAGKTIPKGLKPDVLVAGVAARLKSSPFKTAKLDGKSQARKRVSKP